jgi:hypothetical protein
VTNREIVAWGFRIGGWVLGVPSLVALVTVIAGLFVPRHRRPADQRRQGRRQRARRAGRLSELGRVVAPPAPGWRSILLWLTILMSLPRGGAMAVPAVGMALSLYAIWVLVWR